MAEHTIDKIEYKGNVYKLQDNISGFLTATEILNFFYPVGSYYETSDVDFDPNNTWGGTWELETAGQVHVSAGADYTIGDTGGSKDANMQPYIVVNRWHRTE